jgi:hypothetical protein
MKQIYVCRRPENSLLKECMYRDFSDSFAMTLNKPNISIDEVVNCFLTTSPNIVIRIMQLRDFLVKCVDLKTGAFLEDREAMSFKPGNGQGLFLMYHCNENEAIVGSDDKHHNFRTSLYVKPSGTKTEVLISTVVVVNDNLGKCYLNVVAPFHKMVVRLIMKNMYETLMALNTVKKERFQTA